MAYYLTFNTKDENQWTKEITYLTRTIVDDTKAKAFAEFFSEYENRSKYNNEVHHTIPNEEARKEYYEWISDEMNYASSGGDMW